MGRSEALKPQPHGRAHIREQSTHRGAGGEVENTKLGRDAGPLFHKLGRDPWLSAGFCDSLEKYEFRVSPCALQLCRGSLDGILDSKVLFSLGAWDFNILDHASESPKSYYVRILVLCLLSSFVMIFYLCCNK